MTFVIRNTHFDFFKFICVIQLWSNKKIQHKLTEKKNVKVYSMFTIRCSTKYFSFVTSDRNEIFGSVQRVSKNAFCENVNILVLININI